MSGPEDMRPPDGGGEDGGADGGGDAAQAAEYALGLLPPREAAAFESRLAAEPDLRAELALWQERLAGIAEAEVPPVAPPARVKAHTEAALFGRPEAPVAALRARLTFWRTFGALATAAAIALAVVFLQQATEPAPPDLVAQIEGGADGPPLLVTAAFRGEAGTLAITASEATPPPGRVLELWLIAEGSDAPVSLGVLPEAETATLDVAPEIAASLPGGTLAISEEPPGGSPTGAPTGAVLGTGPVTPL